MAIVIVNNWGHYERPFKEIDHTFNAENKEDIVDNLNDINLIVFTGGTDISTWIYGEAAHPATSFPDTSRDREEMAIFELATSCGIPMVGICRGAQFLCAMNGGKLYQDIRGHGRDHLMFSSNHKPMSVSSTHHQMMRPNYHNKRAILLGWAAQKSLEDESPEPEVVWWPNSCCLGIQYHPEYLEPSSEAFKYAVNLTKSLIFNEDLCNV
jgi:gamma-glutamyl-gamma-aminobutyrate hydrolase PuuD